MTFNWSTFATLAILAATLHWLVARAAITHWFWSWSRLPAFVNELLTCPACSGFWLGLGLGAAGLRPLTTGHAWLDIAVAGAAGIFGTPVAEAVMLWGLDRSRID
jgi:hypothetical protein